MKMKKLMGLMAIVVSASLVARAEKVSEAQLPPAVQRTLQQQKGTDTVKDIEKETRNGRVVYEVEFSRTGLNPKLQIADDGSVLRDARGRANDSREPGAIDRTVNAPRGPVSARMQTMKIEDVPAAVRSTIEKQAAGRKVADIDKETWKNKTVYEVEFDQTGRNEQIHIAEDGTIVKADKPATSGAKGLLMGTQLNDTPPAVQKTIQREANGLEIADIDKERRSGRTIYEVEFKNPGRNIEIHVAEDGTIVKDNRKDASAIGAPGTEPQTRIGGARGNNVTLAQVPAAVQQAIRTNGDPAAIKEIERGERNGRTVYVVEFQKEGRNKKITVAEDGTVLKDNKE
jgi:uncharacterized membrane protein YkoI